MRCDIGTLFCVLKKFKQNQVTPCQRTRPIGQINIWPKQWVISLCLSRSLHTGKWHRLYRIPFHRFLYSLSRYADAITTDGDGKSYFAEPHITRMTMAKLLAELAASGTQVKIITNFFVRGYLTFTR